MNGIDLTDLKAALVAHAGDLAQHLLGAATARLSSKRELRWGKHGSFSLVLVGSKAGIWRDHETEETGDLLALINKVRGGSFPDALEFARGFIGGNFVQPSTPPPRRRDDDQDSDAARTKAALNIWHSADSIEHPIVSRYLERRKLIVPSGIDGTVLRFIRIVLSALVRVCRRSLRSIATSKPTSRRRSCGRH
jgi:putative DNA primase/helicase